MFADKFKTSKKVELAKEIKIYVSKHYDMNAFNKIESLCNELDFARNSAISVGELDKSADSMNKAKNTIVDYLRLLTAIKQRMSFGNDELSVKVCFSWRDVLKDSNYSSYHFAHEYYNNLFNLAVCLVNLGKSVSFKSDDIEIKAAIKNFNQAAWLFDKIKQEASAQIPAKELMPDLSSAYLTYCNNFAIAQSQALIFEISGRKGMSNELQAQLSRGIYDFLTQCLNFTNEGLKSYSDNLLRTYLNNRRYWYFALGLLKMREHQNEEFKSKAIGYGKMIAYTSLAKDALVAGAKDMKDVSKLINLEDYSNKLKEVENDITVMREKNRKIYYDGEPNPSTLPKIEKKMMANPVQFSEDLTSTTQYNDLLKELVPKEIKASIDQYKEKILEYVSGKLSSYENECKIDKFLLDLGLPGNLESALCQDQLSDYLWKRINEVQQKGGSMYLNSLLSNNDSIKEETKKKLNNINIILLDEENQDNQFRQMYGNRWTREPSNKLNFTYLGAINQIAGKIEAAGKCDEGIKEAIKENQKYYELLGLNKAALEKKIPVKVEGDQLKEVQEAKDLKNALETLEKLKQENRAAVENVFNNLNDENVIPYFLDFKRKQSSESNFMKEQFEKYDKLLAEVAKFDQPIAEIKKAITEKNAIFLKIREIKLKPKPENEKFFKDLDDYCTSFNEKLNNIYQGNNFYNGLNNKIDELYGNVSDYILSRDLEKNDLLKSQKGGYIGQTIDFTKQSNQGSKL